ncbi:hypothetical protein [Acidovorax cavernicola]|uniref:hypothetical protein n=1 Tax=Acidovorax cavernicola TaxID=1675792 RepID=UPI0011C42120|nr:hypothetical protein [Acidovorax cavernicola]
MKSTTWSRSLQMALCATAVCSFGAVNAQTPPPAGAAGISQSQSEVTHPAQAPAVRSGSRDGMPRYSPSRGESQSQSDVSKPAQAPAVRAGSRDGMEGTPPVHSRSTGMSQSESEEKNPAQAPAGAGGK